MAKHTFTSHEPLHSQHIQPYNLHLVIKNITKIYIKNVLHGILHYTTSGSSTVIQCIPQDAQYSLRQGFVQINRNLNTNSQGNDF